MLLLLARKSISRRTMSYPLPKDPQVRAYLEHIRKRNLKEASQCHICKKQSTGINSDGYRIQFVCDDHLDPIVPVIIPNDMPGVDHRIYPEGLAHGPLDPNVGGYIKRDPIINTRHILNRETDRVDISPNTSDTDIWATQITFE